MYKVLIADDEQRTIEGLELLIDWEKHGFEICATAETGDEALILYEQHKPDLMILDISMPVYSGIECAKLLRERGVETEIVIITGYNEITYAREAIKYGVRYYLNKPINSREVEEALQTIKTELDRKQMFSSEFWKSFIPDKKAFERISESETVKFTKLMEMADSIVNCIKNHDTEGINHILDKVINYSICCDESLNVINIFIAYLETQLMHIMPDSYKTTIEQYMDKELSVDESVSELKPVIYELCLQTMNILRKTDNTSETNFDMIEKYLREHYKEEIIIKELAKIFHMNHVYLGVVFSKKAGINIKTYVHMLRMKEASRLMNETNMSLKDIAYEVGYNNYNNFFAWFEKIFGTIPEEYRKKSE